MVSVYMFAPTQSRSCYLETDFINLSDEELSVCKQSFNPVIYLRHGSLQNRVNIYTNNNRSGMFYICLTDAFRTIVTLAEL